MTLSSRHYRKHRTSAQIAIADDVFRELFGMIWRNRGYIILNANEYSLAVLYKDIVLQAANDWVNSDHLEQLVKNPDAVKSAERWIWNESVFNDSVAIAELKTQVCTAAAKKLKRLRSKKKIKDLETKTRKLLSRFEFGDPFDFTTCCEVVGLDSADARAKLEFYRGLKIKHGHDIRIVVPTGGSDLPKPDKEDILEAAKQSGGDIDMSMFLHRGIRRAHRDAMFKRKV